MNAETIQISDFTVSVERGDTKYMYLRVLPPDGNVLIKAPEHVSLDDMRRFAISKLSWLKRERAKYQTQPRLPERQYETGDCVRIWGDVCRLRIVHSWKCNDVRRDGDWIKLQTRPNSTPKQRENILNEWYRKQLREALDGLIPLCEKIVGVNADFYGIKKMATRWGSCQIEKRRIWLNLHLVQKTRASLQYVLIHELVHLQEPTHNERFSMLMTRYCPNWRSLKDHLNGQALEPFERKHL